MKRMISPLVGKIALVLGCILLISAASFAQTDENERLEHHTFSHGEIDRTYAIYVPSSYDPTVAAPLVIALHPSGSRAVDMAAITGFNAIAEREGFVVLYPVGPNGYWDYGAGLESWAEVDDVLDDPGFIVALVATIQETYTIDPARIYAAGYSNGARMAYRLGCELPLAAIATVAATISDEITAACPPEVRVSVLYIHGLNDQVIPWTGKPLHIGDTFISNALSVVETATFWAIQNQCDLEPEYFNLPDADPDDGLSVGQVKYATCEAETEVVLYGVRGGGHQWRQSPDLDTSEFIWSFFASHPRSETTADPAEASD